MKMKKGWLKELAQNTKTEVRAWTPGKRKSAQLYNIIVHYSQDKKLLVGGSAKRKRS
jgi:hypothetical protein